MVVGVNCSFCSRRVGRKKLSSRCAALSGEWVLPGKGFFRVRTLELSVFLLRLGRGSHRGVEQGCLTITPFLGTGRVTRA